MHLKLITRLFLLIAFFALQLYYSNSAYAQTPEIIKLPKLKEILKPESDTTYVINFWATWCKPCIKELPYFEELQLNYKNEKVKVLLVSLDFKRHLDSQLIPFLKKNKIQSTVLLLDEPDANLWIDIVDPSWSGAIPVTLVINSQDNKRLFYEKEFVYSELENIIKPLIKK